MLFFINIGKVIDKEFKNLNTSHVILYHYAPSAMVGQYLFKYISCYSLSTAGLNIPFQVSEFKYISCYSLSRSSPDKDPALCI